MISLEKQCVSLELAKRLKELGVKQESLFYWAKFNSEELKISYVDFIEEWGAGKVYSAFTVAELGSPLSNSTSVERAMMIDASAVPITAVRAKTILELPTPKPTPAPIC